MERSIFVLVSWCRIPQSDAILTQDPALTDALIAGIANGQTSYKIVGRYISTPLRWFVRICSDHFIEADNCRVNRAVITGKDSKYQSIGDLKGTKLGISRLGRYVNPP